MTENLTGPASEPDPDEAFCPLHLPGQVLTLSDSLLRVALEECLGDATEAISDAQKNDLPFETVERTLLRTHTRMYDLGCGAAGDGQDTEDDTP